jgi:hypothetical protein
MNEFDLAQTADRFAQCVVTAITPTADNAAGEHIDHERHAQPTLSHRARPINASGCAVLRPLPDVRDTA